MASKQTNLKVLKKLAIERKYFFYFDYNLRLWTCYPDSATHYAPAGYITSYSIEVCDPQHLADIYFQPH